MGKFFEFLLSETAGNFFDIYLTNFNILVHRVQAKKNYGNFNILEGFAHLKCIIPGGKYLSIFLFY